MIIYQTNVQSGLVFYFTQNSFFVFLIKGRQVEHKAKPCQLIPYGYCWFPSVWVRLNTMILWNDTSCLTLK